MRLENPPSTTANTRKSKLCSPYLPNFNSHQLRLRLNRPHPHPCHQRYSSATLLLLLHHLHHLHLHVHLHLYLRWQVRIHRKRRIALRCWAGNHVRHGHWIVRQRRASNASFSTHDVDLNQTVSPGNWCSGVRSKQGRRVVEDSRLVTAWWSETLRTMSRCLSSINSALEEWRWDCRGRLFVEHGAFVRNVLWREEERQHVGERSRLWIDDGAQQLRLYASRVVF